MSKMTREEKFEKAWQPGGWRCVKANQGVSRALRGGGRGRWPCPADSKGGVSHARPALPASENFFSQCLREPSLVIQSLVHSVRASHTVPAFTQDGMRRGQRSLTYFGMYRESPWAGTEGLGAERLTPLASDTALCRAAWKTWGLPRYSRGRRSPPTLETVTVP